MIQEYDMWNPKDLGYGFEWDGHWFYWSPPEVAPVLQTLLVAIGGVLLLYGLAPTLLRKRLLRQGVEAAVPARFQHSLLLGGALLSFVNLLRADEDFLAFAEPWLILSFLVVLTRPTIGKTAARQVGVTKALAFLVLTAMSTVCALPGEALAQGALLAAPVGLLAAAVALRRRRRPPAHLASATAAWTSLGTVPAVVLALAIAVEWFPFDPHHTGPFLVFLVTLPLLLGVGFAMTLLVLAEPHLVADRPGRKPLREQEA